MRTTLNNLIRCYRRRDNSPIQLRSLAEKLRSRHEECQQTRLIFEGDDIPEGCITDAIRDHLLNIEAGWCELAAIVEDAMEEAEKEAA